MATAVQRRPATTQKLDHILACATRVFNDKGYEGASIRDIAQRSRVSLAGLYYYVESKEELLYLIQRHSFTTLLARLEDQLEGAGPRPEARLRLFIRNHLQYFLQNREAMKVLSHEAESLTPPFAAEVAELKRAYYRRARNLVEDLKQERGLKGLNTRVAVLSLFGMMNWIYTWHNPRLDPNADALAEHIAGLFLKGVGAATNSTHRHKASRNGRPRAG
ncbi:MAG TPA: TetR family transcriptional regulator [Candidatus Acidoferrales bacterium]|nr:TetR family transcriptional regulator [Candidatus Acidoferrales bacterium]